MLAALNDKAKEIKKADASIGIVSIPMADGGEGLMDEQTKYGKTVFGILKAARKYKIPVVGICGSVGQGVDEVYYFSIYSQHLWDYPIEIEPSYLLPYPMIPIVLPANSIMG